MTKVYAVLSCAVFPSGYGGQSEMGFLTEFSYIGACYVLWGKTIQLIIFYMA